MTESMLDRLSPSALVTGYLAVSLDGIASRIRRASAPEPVDGFEPDVRELIHTLVDERDALLRVQRLQLAQGLVERIPHDLLTDVFHEAVPEGLGTPSALAASRALSFVFRTLLARDGVPHPVDPVVERLTQKAGAMHGILLTGRVAPVRVGRDGSVWDPLRREVARALLVRVLDPVLEPALASDEISWIRVGPRVRCLLEAGLRNAARAGSLPSDSLSSDAHSSGASALSTSLPREGVWPVSA
jgi:hypothetical protein